MKTNSKSRLSKMVAYAAMVLCIMVVGFFVLGMPGMKMPDDQPHRIQVTSAR